MSSDFPTTPPLRNNKLFVTAIILLVIIVVVAALFLTRPQANKKFESPPPQIGVAIETIKRSQIEPTVRSYGIVEPRVKSKLVAQVSGRVETISERFRDGGFFQKGEVLLEIESADYRIEVAIAEANKVEAERRLEEEYAQAAQAKEDWARLEQDGSPSPLVLREPQVKAAKANLQAAKARLDKAKLNLARTRISAPFDGRVLTTNVDVGQVTSTNGVLGEIYATDAIEVRLPIKNSDLKLITLPESYSHKNASDKQALPDVSLQSEIAGDETWLGKIVRTAGAIDSETRQLYIVARVDDPFGKKAEGRFPLKIGQYITAQIKGKPINDAIVIPNKTIYQGSYVYVWRDGAVYRQDIDIAWQNGDYAVISAGLDSGQKLVSSPLGKIASGTLVNTLSDDGVELSTEKTKRGRAKKNQKQDKARGEQP